MTIVEMGSACKATTPVDYRRHPFEAPELSLGEMFYPLGFPTVVRTNSPEILSLASDLWSAFTRRFDTKPIRVDVHLVEGDSAECPPTPAFRVVRPLLINTADSDNYSITNIERNATQIVLSRETLKYRSYLNYFFLAAAPLSHIATVFATPVHAGCVTHNGRGVLLCGESGAGKSTLSYACARAGWTYVSDDSTYLLNGGGDRLVTGNCHQVRFRPSAAELFPEVAGLEITPRAAGKPSIELPTASMQGITCATTAQVDFLVLLNRHSSGPQELVPWPKDAARHYLREVLFGSGEFLAPQYAALERLLMARIVELRYSDLDWAVHRLETLTREGI
jgi:hypothetical protein